MTLAEAHAALFRRYLDRMEGVEDPVGGERTSLENLRWMCREGAAKAHELPLDKIARWLGFVQGCLATRGLVDVDEERDVSRPLFHAAYAGSGTDVPPTLERPKG